MVNNKMRPENLMWLLTLLMLLILLLEDNTNYLMVAIFGTLTIAPFLLGGLFDCLREKKWFFTFVLNLKYSSVMFIAGIFFTRLLVKNLQFPGYLLFISITACGIIIVFSSMYYILDYMYKIEKVLEDKIRSQKNSSITGFEELLSVIDKKGGNVLAVAGNLLSLKTVQGINLLKKFLSADSLNKITLIIPKESEDYLPEIKNSIKLDSLLGRIKVIKYLPFWFLQGIVIIGKIDSNYQNAMTPVGCYYYKTKFIDEDDMAKEGIFIDLSNQNIHTDYKQAILAHYFIMTTLNYSLRPYEVDQVYKKDSYSYNPQIEVVDWNTVQGY